MKYLTIDTECTCLKIDPKELNGNPFSPKNFLCYVGLLTDDDIYYDFSIEYDDEPYGEQLKQIQELINAHDCLVGFNIKFDIHWLNRYNISIQKRVFDTQLAEFILDNQRIPYPSLNDVAISYGFDGKIDIVKEQYWNLGIDTEFIPRELLREYLKNDVIQTKKVFLQQEQILPNTKRRLVSLQCQDLSVLVEIEKNGMLFDVETSKAKACKTAEEISTLDEALARLIGFEEFNPDSGDHISVVLFGGTLYIPYRETYTFTYKDGHTAEKQRWGKQEKIFPKLLEPPKGSELKKEGFYSTNEDTLNSLTFRKGQDKAKQIVELLLKRGKLEKLHGTYLKGIPDLIEKMGWEDNIIHGQLNQVVARTGRLSSSKPNLQNFDKSIGYLFKSRYEE